MVGADGLTRRQRYYRNHKAEVRAREDAKIKARRAGPEGDLVRAARRAIYAKKATHYAASAREYTRTHPAAQAYRKTYQAAYQAANEERLKAARRARRAARTEEQRDHDRRVGRLARKAWREAHRDAFRARAAESSRRRRAADKSPGVQSRDWLRLLRRYDYRCAYCGIRPNKLEQEHVFPIDRGGRHSIGNILPACRTCNSSKNRRFLVEWRARKTVHRAA